MTDDLPLPTGQGYHWTAEQVRSAYDAVLDAVLAGGKAEEDRLRREMRETEHPVGLDGLKPWSEECRGVPTCSRAAELDQLSAYAEHVDEVDRLFHELMGYTDIDGDDADDS